MPLAFKTHAIGNALYATPRKFQIKYRITGLSASHPIVTVGMRVCNQSWHGGELRCSLVTVGQPLSLPAAENGQLVSHDGIYSIEASGNHLVTMPLSWFGPPIQINVIANQIQYDNDPKWAELYSAIDYQYDYFSLQLAAVSPLSGAPLAENRGAVILMAIGL